MKNSITIMFLMVLNIAQGQYFEQTNNLDYLVPLLRNERFNAGIKTSVNYIAATPAFFYHASIGTSYNNIALAAPNNVADRMRFTSVGTTGATLFSNKGYQFANSGGPWLNSSGNGIAEIRNGAGTGGYVAVGAVSDNAVTQATVVGGSDILFTQLTPTGSIVNASRIDINNGKDIAWSIKRSRVITANGDPTWIICGQSININNNSSDCFVARVLSNGAIIWCKRYNFLTPNGNPAYCVAKQLCEDINNNIYVVGTWQVPGAGNINGLAYKIVQGGGLTWAKTYHLNMDVKFQAVRVTNAGNSIVVGGQINNAATSHMLLLEISANGNLGFQNILRAQDGAGNLYPSQCHDVVQIPTGEYFLAGFLIKNGVNIQMMYKTTVAGAGLSWYRYNELLYKEGFSLDYVDGAFPGIAFFSSTKNSVNPIISDSHIMKTDIFGKTCPAFCGMEPPSTLQIALENVDHNCNPVNAGTRAVLDTLVNDYNRNIICNVPNPCVAAAIQPSANISQATSSPELTGKLNISPNPFFGMLHLFFNALPVGDYQITIVNMRGETILQKNKVFNNGSSVVDIDMASASSGVYIITVTKDNLVIQKKIIKQ